MIDRFLNCTYGIKLYINEKHEKNSEPMKSEKKSASEQSQLVGSRNPEWTILCR